MSNNLSTILDSDGGRLAVREYLDEVFLERKEEQGVLANTAYAMPKAIPDHKGQYIEMTRKDHLRRPQNMPSPGGSGSDPLSGAVLGGEKVKVPLEFIHEFLKIGTVANMTSWIDLEEWAEHDLPEALRKRRHEKMQNALVVGRMKPGVYDANGDLSTAFDAEAEATVTLYGFSWTFQPAAVSYAGGADTWDDMVTDGNKLTWDDLKRKRVQLSLSGAPKINGKYVCVLSDAGMYDLLSDGEMGEAFGKAMQGGSKPLIKGVEDQWIASFAGWHFVEDDHPFTMDSAGGEEKRAEWGDYHAAFCFGGSSFGSFHLGGYGKGKPKFKVQDITLTGYEKSIGYLVPDQEAVVNPNWCAVIKHAVTVSKPNNYSADNKQLAGFELPSAV